MYNKILQEHLEVITSLQDSKDAVKRAVELCLQALKNGNKLLLCGNGGSAADSQHIAAEFVGRFVRERRGLPALALTTDTSILTAVGNDYGYEQVFARQVQALGKSGDVLLAISTSGNSKNVLAAIEQAKELRMSSIGFTGGNQGKMGDMCDICLAVPSAVTARIQEGHILLAHIICQMVDEEWQDGK